MAKAGRPPVYSGPARKISLYLTAANEKFLRVLAKRQGHDSLSQCLNSIADIARANAKKKAPVTAPVSKKPAKA